jgi:hypothetical protein
MSVKIGTTFTDPYLDVPDIVFEVNAKVDDELWQAEIVSGPESSLGVMDLYEEAHILMFRTE